MHAARNLPATVVSSLTSTPLSPVCRESVVPAVWDPRTNLSRSECWVLDLEGGRVCGGEGNPACLQKSALPAALLCHFSQTGPARGGYAISCHGRKYRMLLSNLGCRTRTKGI